MRSYLPTLSQLLWTGLAALLLLLSILIVRTFMLSHDPMETDDVHSLDKDRQAVAERLADALAIPTISLRDVRPDTSAFEDLHEHIDESFPRVEDALEKRTINDLSLLYRWEGQDTEAAPILLMAHLDVVPADEDQWTHDPFGGVIADDFIWGRGALDNKSGVTGILEAVEFLLERDFTPPRTIYLAFGHDEEIGGRDGAQEVARTLEEEGVHFEYILDEGGAITDGALIGVEEPIAGIGVAEKGFMTLELVGHGPAAHSSTPPLETAIGSLSRAITRIKTAQFAPRLLEPTRTLLESIGPSLPFFQRMAVANKWLFGRLIARQLASQQHSAPLVRTTFSPTRLQAGVSDNVVPGMAQGVVNMRLLPGDTHAEATEYIETIIEDLPVETRERPPGGEASEVSEVDGPDFERIERTLRQVYSGDELIVSPYLIFGATDSRHYRHLADNTYGFTAFRLGEGDVNRIHGVDERISIRDYARMVRFYVQFIRNVD